MNNKTKIAINGFGRIGRNVYKAIQESSQLEVVAINDLAEPETLKHLLKYDSIYGRWEKEIPDSVKFLAEPDPEKIPWPENDVVIESTGRFTDFENASKHKAKLVVISAPSKSEEVPHFVYEVNHERYDGQKIISAGSCTTVVLAHLAKKLNDAFEIEAGFMTTVHAYTNNQKLLDLPHKDLRRARAAALSIVPTTTGAAKAVEKVIPELKGKLDGIALRVPVSIVSAVDFICQVKKKTTVEEVNNIFEDKIDEPLVSIDLKGDPRPAIVDTQLTMVNDNLVKVVAWYDNEYGYSVQLVKLIKEVIKNE